MQPPHRDELTKRYARPITDAARLVHARLSRKVTLELADLVQVGWERVSRYLADGTASPIVVFICARDGMFDEVRRWQELPADARTLRAWRAAGGDEIGDTFGWPRYTPALDIELLIDVKRALLDMKLREAASWYSRHVLDEPVGKLGPEFGVGRGRICQYEISARARLREVVLDGEPHRPSTARIMGTAKLKRSIEERTRYAELRKLGATVKQATRGAKSPNCFASMLRQLES